MIQKDDSGSLEGFMQMLGLISERYELIKSATSDIRTDMHSFKENPENLESSIVKQLQQIMGERKYDALLRMYNAYTEMIDS